MPYFFILLLILTIKTIGLVFLIMTGDIGLGPDEAQYWTWSRHIDFGYYSKPPGIAWEILLGTTLFGQTELGVRAMPLVIGFFLPIILFFIGKRINLSPSVSFWGSVCLSLSPLGLLASFLTITDGGMVLFWMLACFFLIDSIEKKITPNYLVLGFILMGGGLFKWPIYSFWLLVFFASLFYPWMLTVKSLPKLFLGVIVSFLAFLPSIYWNMSHEWATFRHVFTTISGGHNHTHLISRNPLEFFGAQAALISPILFILLLVAWYKAFRHYKIIPPSILFCAVSSFSIFLVGMIASLFMKMQGNWLIFAYPIAFILIGWISVEGIKKKWMISGVALSLILTICSFSIPYIQGNNIFSSLKIPYRLNPFRHNIGWKNLDPLLKSKGYDEDKDFLLSATYQTTSILSFYGPKQKRAYFLNLGGARKNQFSFWKGMKEEQQGKKGFFVVIENTPHLLDEGLQEKYLNLLYPYFSQVRYLGMSPLFFSYGQIVKGALIFECEGYTGLYPEETEKY